MDEARLYPDGLKLVDDVRDMLEGETGAEVIALLEDESVQEEEDEEYDPRVKADVVKHLVNMYNDAKKDDGYLMKRCILH